LLDDRLEEAAEDGEADFEVASMDDEARFGPVLHRLAFSEAIERGLLSDYRVAIIGVDDATYRAYAEEGRFVTMDGKAVTDARTLAGQIGLLKAMRAYELRRVVSFHGRIKRARHFSGSVPEVRAWMPAEERPSGALWTDFVSGEMTSGERDVLLGRFRDLDPGERGLLSNARCLGEGVDVPSIDGVAFIDPRRSQIDIVQAVGRAIRLSPDKKIGTVVLPVFIDVTADPEVMLDDSVFRPVWDVLKALRTHDDVLAEQLDALRRAFGAKTAKDLSFPAKIHIDLPVAIDAEFARAFKVRLVEQTTATWEDAVARLRAFITAHGHARVPVRCVTDGFPLGQWVQMKRTTHKRGQLPLEQVRRLESIDGWSWDVHRDRWERGVASLTTFVARFKHPRVPATYVDEDGCKLGAWAQQRRIDYHATPRRLSESRVRCLEQFDGWTWNLRDEAWEQAFAALQQFRERKGHALVPDGHV
jgi:hypothetical protein